MRRVFSLFRSDILLAFVLSALVVIAYFPVLHAGFYGDDWIFFELAGRLSLPEYLKKYFDPYAQTAWYRPVQGVMFRLEYGLWGNNPVPYHWRNIVLHLSNGLWLWGIVRATTHHRRLAFLAALLFATWPTAAVAVFWPGVVDPLLTFFYLAAVRCWLVYLKSTRPRDYWLAFTLFILALLSKEVAIGLPLVLFLLDRWGNTPGLPLRALVRRYLWFVIPLIPYALIEWIVVQRSVFVNREGYAASPQLFNNLLDYSSALVFPWSFVPLLNYTCLLIVGLAIAYFVVRRRARLPLVPSVGAVMVILPVIPFPFVVNRFLYLALVASAILYAVFFDYVLQHLSQSWLTRPSRMAIAILVLVGAANISNAARDFAEWARVSRVPFRDVRQAHPTFPEDSYVYFVNPPLPGPNLSGMFFWHYGSHVQVGATDLGQPARWREHSHTYIIWFDEQHRTRELPVEKDVAVEMRPAPPLDLGAPLRLEGYELARANVTREQAIVLLVYLRALDRLEQEYGLTLALVDAHGKAVAQMRRTLAPAWAKGTFRVEAFVMPLADAAPGEYRLEITAESLTHAPIILTPIKVLE